MRNSFLKLAIVALSVAPVWSADEIKLPASLERLAERATDSVDVKLDSSSLQLASAFLSQSDPDEVEIKRLVSKLKGIYVRSFEFGKEGEYSQADIDVLRSQLKSPGWSRLVGVKSGKDNTEVYMLKNGDQMGGLLVIAAEPKQLTIVHIDGPITPEDLQRLSGHLGVPALGKAKPKPKPEAGPKPSPKGGPNSEEAN